MKKSKLFSLLMTMFIVGILTVGGTLAYFTDYRETSNVVKIGHVDIRLTENTVNMGRGSDGRRAWIQDSSEQGITDSGILFEGVLPGDIVPKNPTLTLQPNSLDAYVRVKLDFVSEGNNGLDADMLSVLESRVYAAIANGGVWTRTDDYLYYPTAMTAGDKAVLFDSIRIPDEWDERSAEKGFVIKVHAEAIQKDAVAEDGVVITNGGRVVSWNLGSGPDAITIEEYNP